MDRQLLERLTGAAVLVVGLVIIAPAILNGPEDATEEGRPEIAAAAATAAATADTRRVHTIRLDAEQDTPPVARQVPPEPPAESRSEVPSTDDQSTATQPVSVDSTPPQVAAVRQPQRSEPEARTQASEPEASKPATPPKTVSRAAAAKPDTPEPTPAAGSWVVQLGSFSSEQNARQLAENVSGKGFQAFMMPVDRSGKKLYRVRVGPSESRPQAEELAARLNRAGFQGQVTQQ